MSNSDTIKSEIDRLRAAVAELTVLNEMALAASSSLEVDQVLNIIVQKAIKAIRAEQGSIMLVTPHSDNPLQTLIRRENLSGTMPAYKVGTHISGWVLKHKQSLIVEDLANDPRFKVSAEEAKMIRSVLCVPIYFKGELLGLLIMTNKRSGDAFNKDDQRLLTIIAAQSGQIIRNSQLQQDALEKKRLTFELDLAREMQKKLLPGKVPGIAGLDIASYFRPHKAVSGDYYDYIQLQDGKWGVIIADVSGHGPSAALVMTLVKGVVHSVLGDNPTPGEALQKINRIISKIIPPDMFVTMLYLTYEPQNRQIRLANAGHNPLLHYDNESGKYRIMKATGCPVNVLPEAQYQDQEFTLQPGDVLLLFTDGLPEAINAENELLGINRIAELLHEHADQTAHNLIGEIVGLLDSHQTDKDLSDDIVIIVLKMIAANQDHTTDYD